MINKLGYGVGILLLTGCTTVGMEYKEEPAINLTSTIPDNRIVITPTSFYLTEGQRLTPMQPDEHLAFLAVSTLEKYLQEKGYAAFFAGKSQGVLTESEAVFLAKIDPGRVVENYTESAKLFDPIDPNVPTFKQVPKILFPLFVCKKADAATRFLFHPGTLEVTIYALLADAHTGHIVWSNSMQKIGNYNTLELELRGLRWGHGVMRDLLETFPRNSAYGKSK